MDRRILLLAAAATATAGPAWAQQPCPTAMGDAEKTHATKIATIGGASLTMADIALRKATNAKVKEFAKFEHDEQTTVGEILKSMDPSLTPPSPPADITGAIDKLRRMQAGSAFDREFVSAQIHGHDILRTYQEDYLKIGHDPDMVNATKLVLLVINEHLTLLSDIKKAV